MNRRGRLYGFAKLSYELAGFGGKDWEVVVGATAGAELRQLESNNNSRR